MGEHPHLLRALEAAVEPFMRAAAAGRSDRFRRAVVVVLRCARSMVGDDRRACGLPSRKRIAEMTPTATTTAAAAVRGRFPGQAEWGTRSRGRNPFCSCLLGGGNGGALWWGHPPTHVFSVYTLVVGARPFVEAPADPHHPALSDRASPALLLLIAFNAQRGSIDGDDRHAKERTKEANVEVSERPRYTVVDGI
ncbi:hypothetical protein MTO96_027165 [Rhipicephalus appendiculatus]